MKRLSFSMMVCILALGGFFAPAIAWGQEGSARSLSVVGRASAPAWSERFGIDVLVQSESRTAQAAAGGLAGAIDKVKAQLGEAGISTKLVRQGTPSLTAAQAGGRGGGQQAPGGYIARQEIRIEAGSLLEAARISDMLDGMGEIGAHRTVPGDSSKTLEVLYGEAIAEARKIAARRARQLGVRLGKILRASFVPPPPAREGGQPRVEAFVEFEIQ